MPSPRILLRVLLAVALAATLLPIARPAAALDAATFVAKTSAWAQAEEREYGVPASVAMAQAILESGWGESSLTKNARNWFGIKCSSTVSPHQNGCYAVNTTEYDSSGTAYTTTAQFRKYDTDQNSFIDHGYFLSRLTRYAKAFSYTNNPDRFIVEVHLGGYATDPQYANKVINLMVKYNLYQYNVTAAATGASELVIRPQTQAKVGATAYVTGLLSPGGGGREVLTQAYTASGWSTDQRVTSGIRGQFSIPLTSGTNTVGNTRYRVQAASAAGTLTSAEFTVDRLGSISVQAVSGVLVGGTARLKGAAVGYAGRTVTSQVLVSGAWQNHTTATVNSDGSFDLPLTYSQSTAGTRTFRAKLITAAGATLTSGQVTATWSGSSAAPAPVVQPSPAPAPTPVPAPSPTPVPASTVRLLNGTSIGQGWTAERTIFPGDWDRNGHEDLMLRTSAGDLLLYRASATGRFDPGVKIGNGWGAAVEIIGGQDWTGDGWADLVSRFTDGRLVLYPGNGKGGFAMPQQIGHGWQSFARLTSVGDSVGGNPGVVAARVSGEVLLYPSNGSGALGLPLQLATDWGALRSITGVDDWDGNGFSDLVAIESTGHLRYMAVGANGLVSSQHGIGTGWGLMRELGGISTTSTTRFLFAVRTDGRLFSYEVARG
ncbi:glucosaminidase domain-containing protein [Tessaracoccus sp. MC1679]|uniref:glucosaminidase domain-containing protein n=1 Tax=Tessaracoccus sp. MC1679 TaxID=2760313 RepID=UPI001603EDDC|nr:glucosaminidase domain-containing protein [Tessaracoccus sp. MC1679]MBB1514776.1 glucosaminidase domain-containing protein [Tessaracoccus sp. MC1679]